MPRHLIVEYADKTIALLYPVPRAKLMLLDELLRRLQQHWLEVGDVSVFSTREWQVIDAIVSIVPSLPKLPFLAEPLIYDLDLTTRLFLYTTVGDQLAACELVKLHQFEPLPRRKRQEGESITAADLPFPNSGDADCDTQANWINGYKKFGLWMYNNLDAETLDKVSFSLGELARPEDDRVNEYISQLFDEYQQQHPEYKRSLIEDW